MFFKSRVQRDIDQFRALQKLDSRRIQQSKGSGQPEAQTPGPGECAPSFTEPTGSVGWKEIAGEASGHKESVVSVGATWEGKLTTGGSAWIEGEMSGDVEAGDAVFVARGAKVRANIHARRVIVGGDLEGHVTCREQLVVESSGRLGGRARARTIIVEDGAVVHSAIQMQCDEDATPPAATTLLRRDSGALGAAAASQRLNALPLERSGSIALGQQREE